MAYLWAEDGRDRVLARFFFLKYGALTEDPGTGSACANLGGWIVATGARRPRTLTINQGEAVGRPCHLHLTVDAAGGVSVGGRVVELGRGAIEL
jgi:predicted PhzF superfamily epimerase YddE/YHI9